MINLEAEYGMLSTFEHTYICKIEKNETTGFLKNSMKIAGPYPTSQAAALQLGKPYEPFLKVAFVVFSLAHTTEEGFKPIKFEEKSDLIESVSSESEGEKKDPSYQAEINEVIGKTHVMSLQSQSNPEPKPKPKESSSSKKQQHLSIILPFPTLKKSYSMPHLPSLSKPSLWMPDFSKVKSFSIDRNSHLGEGSCASVCFGHVNGVKVAVKVRFSYLFLNALFLQKKRFYT